MSNINVREKMTLVAEWLNWQEEQLSYGLRSFDDAVILYDAMVGECNHLGEMADEWPEVERIRLLGYDPMQACEKPEERVRQPRHQAVAFIKKQLDHSYEPTMNKGDRVHYGKVELRELMDFIYGGPPQSKRERL